MTQSHPFILGKSIKPLSFLSGNPILSVPFVGGDGVQPRPFSLSGTVQALYCVIELRSSLLGDSISSFTFLGCNAVQALSFFLGKSVEALSLSSRILIRRIACCLGRGVELLFLLFAEGVCRTA